MSRHHHSRHSGIPAMNKGERNRLREVHFQRRLKRFNMRRLAEEQPRAVLCYRSTSTPCSCFFCDPHKWSDEPKHSTRRRLDQSDTD